MKISDYTAWLEEDREDRDRIAATYPQYLQGHIEAQQERDQKRLRRLQQFPYSVVLEGLYDEHDYAACWCWQRFGPQNGPCADHHSTYPACPLVLETEYIERTVYRGAERFHKRYHEPAEHEHSGEWSSLWFGKTDYDYGFGEYYFAQATHLTLFLDAVPAFQWDRSWDEATSA